MHIIIFANGEIATPPAPLPPHDLLLAADGGARLAWQTGYTPDVIIGDLDSLHPEEAAKFDEVGASTFRFPAEKDETDLELALNYALEKKANSVTLFGMLGGRWDMSLANLLLLSVPKYASIRLRAVVGETTIHVLHAGGTLKLQGKPGDRVSVIPAAEKVSGISYQGLGWPLADATLPFGTPRGVSNTLSGHEASIKLESGTVWVFHDSLSA